MANKLPSPNDKGRCNRCALQYEEAPPKRPGHPVGNVCFQYGDYCSRVAWNCTAPSGGRRLSELTDSARKRLSELNKQTGGGV